MFQFAKVSPKNCKYFFGHCVYRNRVFRHKK